MIGLDTNVLLRWLIAEEASANDAPGQTSLVARTILESDEPFFVNHVVLAETAWVLRNRASQPRNAVIEVIKRLLATTNLQIDRPELVEAALATFSEGPGDFADHLIGHLNRHGGCRTTLTFDAAASKTGSLFTKLGR